MFLRKFVFSEYVDLIGPLANFLALFNEPIIFCVVPAPINNKYLYLGKGDLYQQLLQKLPPRFKPSLSKLVAEVKN
jgi:hypothetical protein